MKTGVLALALLSLGAAATQTQDNPQHPLSAATSERLPYAAALHDFFFPTNTCSPPNMRIYKSTSSGGHDLSSMLAFKYPAARYCWMEFFSPPVPAWGRQVDVFTQSQVVDRCPSTSNYRKGHLGRLEIPAGGGKATWVMAFGNYLTSPRSPCPPAGTVEGFEFVGVGDNIDVKWTQGTGKGVRIMYTP